MLLYEALESPFGVPKGRPGLCNLAEVGRGRGMAREPSLRQRQNGVSDTDGPQTLSSGSGICLLSSSYLFPAPQPPPGFMPQLCKFEMIGGLSHLMAKGLLRARSLLSSLSPASPASSGRCEAVQLSGAGCLHV